MSKPLRAPPVISGNIIQRGWKSITGSGDTELVPQPRLAGPMPWVIAIMVALTVIAAAAGLALRNVATAATADLSGGITIQIIEASPELKAAQAKAALAILQQTPGVQSARIVPESEINALIEPWLGSSAAVDGDGVPVPALLDARLTSKVTQHRLDQLRGALRSAAPAAQVDAQAGWLRPVFSAIQSLQWLALTLVAMLASATAAAVLLAARTALGAHRDTIEVVHLLGGTDAQIARVFQRSIGFDAAGGGAVGLGLAMLAMLLLGRSFADLGAGLVSGGALGWTDWLLLALIPFAGVALAMITARLSVLHALRRML